MNHTLEIVLTLFGRLHPMVLHLPIGMLLAWVALEVVACLRRRPLSAEVAVPLAWMTAASGVLSAGTGFVLGLEGGHSVKYVSLHQWLGLATAGVIVAAALARSIRPNGIALPALLILSTALLVPTGHFGASMTHGPDYLFEPLRAPRPDDGARVAAGGPSAPESSVNYARVAAVFDEYCVSCHGEFRTRGGLALHTPEAIVRGGDGGEVVVAGDARSSSLLRRLKLPLDHDDHMPPLEEEQPSEADLLAIEKWIANGASFD